MTEKSQTSGGRLVPVVNDRSSAGNLPASLSIVSRSLKSRSPIRTMSGNLPLSLLPPADGMFPLFVSRYNLLVMLPLQDNFHPPPIIGGRFVSGRSFKRCASVCLSRVFVCTFSDRRIDHFRSCLKRHSCFSIRSCVPSLSLSFSFLVRIKSEVSEK